MDTANGESQNQLPAQSPNPNEGSRSVSCTEGADAVLLRQKRLKRRARWIEATNKIRKRQRVERIVALLTHVPPSQTRSLCETCASMDLSTEKFQVREESIANRQLGPTRFPPSSFDPASGKNKYALGDLKTIWERAVWCPVCNLIMKSAQEQCDDSLEDDPDFGTIQCWASWQLDGRKIVDERGHHVTRVKTRRIKLQWSKKDLQDSYIVLMPDQGWPVDNFMMGRYVDHSRANLDLIRRWVRLCEDNHSNCGPAHSDRNSAEFSAIRQKGFFGVVDVARECLTKLPENEDYIALSYTWGNAIKFTTSLANVRDLRAEGGLKVVKDKLPRAINDAIELTRNLEKRYLWVDALCIVQDSEDSWNLNAQVMDQVYGNAFLTICAADDPDASTGLVGLDPSQRKFSQYTTEYKKGVTLMVSHLSETYIRRSQWNTRAWTFQERLLSRRCLLFTRGRVYFQCRATAMSEDIFAESSSAGWSIELVHAPLQMLSNLPTRALAIYSRCVELYTQRKLARKEDILAAFNGITNLLGRDLDADFVYGLPNSHFDWALLWEPLEPLQRRTPRRASQSQTTQMSRDKYQFPSWSWCGWKGQAYYRPATMMGALANLQEWLMKRTWIIWYIRDGHGDLRMVKRNPPSDTDTNGYHVAAVQDHTRAPADVFGRPLPNCAQGQEGTQFHRVLPDYPFNIAKAKADAKPYPNRPDMRFLQFWSWSSFFWLRAENTDTASRRSPSRLQRYGVIDRKGDWCGTIVLDGSAMGMNLDEPFELVAISEAREFTADECLEWNYYIQTEKENSEWDLYYVLLITRDLEGIAYRLGLGKVFKEAFPNSVRHGDPQVGMGWREFILG